jgi:predicted RNA-binding Zn ribbon-like protein
MSGSPVSEGPVPDPTPPPSAAGRRQPAPGGLELVRSFINSVDIEAGTDRFATAAGIETWFRAQDLPLDPAGISGADRERLIAFREALRDLISCREHGEPDDAALAILDRAGRSSPLTVAFAADGRASLRPDGFGVDGLIGRVLGEAALGAVAGTWPRLKVCRNDACRWAYYDASRNRSGIWCTMAICGNRAKGRALRARRGGSAGAGPGERQAGRPEAGGA